MKVRAAIVANLISAFLPVGVACAQVAVDYYHLDAIGNVLVVTDNAGAVVEQHDYDAFGQEVNAQPGSQLKRFTGKERDTETGWDYFGARYYGAKIGRFTTVDPIYTWRENLTDPQRWNRYAYVRNNPLRYIDPDGREIRLQDGASSDLRRGYQDAKSYLGSAAGATLREVDGRKEVITIVETRSLNPADTHYDPSKKLIHWNPHAALRTSQGGTQTPATVLSHELHHALRDLEDPAQFERDRKAPDAQFGRVVERDAITGTESTVARIKGESVRTNYEGNLEYVERASDRPQPRERK